MDRFIKDKALVFVTAIVMAVLVINSTSKTNAIILDIIILGLFGYNCRELVLLPIDSFILGKITVNCRFIECRYISRYDIFRKYGVGYYLFESNEGKRVLQYPLPCLYDEVTEREFPPKNKTITITYYRLSELLCSWSVVEDE